MHSVGRLGAAYSIGRLYNAGLSGGWIGSDTIKIYRRCAQSADPGLPQGSPGYPGAPRAPLGLPAPPGASQGPQGSWGID